MPLSCLTNVLINLLALFLIPRLDLMMWFSLTILALHVSHCTSVSLHHRAIFFPDCHVAESQAVHLMLVGQVGEVLEAAQWATAAGNRDEYARSKFREYFGTNEPQDRLTVHARFAAMRQEARRDPGTGRIGIHCRIYDEAQCWGRIAPNEIGPLPAYTADGRLFLVRIFSCHIG